jgi:hypothetical protein
MNKRRNGGIREDRKIWRSNTRMSIRKRENN